MSQAAVCRSKETHAAWLLDLFERNVDRTAIIDAATGQEHTYGQLLHDSRVLASFLDEIGVQPGEPIAISMDNCIELALLYFACLHLGARAVPINPSYHPRDYAAILSGVSARFCFTSPAVRGRLTEILADRGDVQIYCLQPTREPAKAEQLALVNLDLQAELQQREPFARTFGAALSGDVAFTMFSSGTTGVPKGINLRFDSLIGNGRAFVQRLGIGPEHRFYNVLAMTYLGGLYNLMLIPLIAEGTLVLDSVFGPSNVFGYWEQVRNFQINTLWFSPTMLSMLLMVEPDEDEGWVREQLRLGLCGMAPLSPELKQRFEQRFGFPLYENFGLSETLFITTSAPDLRPKPGSVGTNIEGVRVQIVDAEMQPLPAGHEGQVAVKTPFLMAGYDKEGDIAPSLVGNEGWFLTGDLGRLDTDGELSITGRLKDLIIRGGVNISPKAIEDVIYRLEAVQEAAVVGVPHTLYGEEVALVVKIRPQAANSITVDDIRKFCDAHLAHFQRPKFVFLIDQIPKGATGKIQKAVLRRLLQDKLDPMNG